MSTVRDDARKLLDSVLPGNTVITSNGATASKYTEMTGLSQKVMSENWARGGIMTGCNGFTGWYGAKMGSKTYLGGFDLEGIVKKAGKPGSWVLSRQNNRPAYGDILRHASFHVDVCLGFDGDVLLRAAGGQGGKSMGCDVIKRVRGTGPYDFKKLVGWIDIDTYFDAATSPSAGDAAMSWLYGWWKVWDGSDYYYYFFPNGSVQYTRTQPTSGSPPPAHPLNTGTCTYAAPATLVIDWNPMDGGSTRETFYNAYARATRMNATSNRYSPLVATRIN
ncbi:hypothetical protein [Variovorax sp. dw_954]|uniref:hypothetical protein n=1 Tax=Variovorax sp. dw_954 TaxID=2720078 RepID=UPI001BD23C6C|nr:hypothetical protein [Variovorax sp. dw_954]